MEGALNRAVRRIDSRQISGFVSDQPHAAGAAGYAAPGCSRPHREDRCQLIGVEIYLCQ